jgi:hypothetical protein
MNIFFIILGCFLLIIFWQIFRFRRYLSFERRCKNEISSYLQKGISLPEAIAQAFSNLNIDKKIGLSEATINRISFGMNDLLQKMDIENVIDIYASFIYLYVFSNGRNMNAFNVTDEKLTNYFFSLKLRQKNGYYALEHSKNNKKQ